MALSEQKDLVSVQINFSSGTVNVLWHNKIMRDGAEIYRVPHRKAYAAEQATSFRAEVAGANAIAAILGW